MPNYIILRLERKPILLDVGRWVLAGLDNDQNC